MPSLSALLAAGNMARMNGQATASPMQPPIPIGGVPTVSGIPDNSRASRMTGRTEAGEYIPPFGAPPWKDEAPVAMGGMVAIPQMGPSAIQPTGGGDQSAGGALTGMMATAKAKGPKFFDRGGLGERIVGVLGDLALYGPAIGVARRQRAEHQQQFEQQQANAALDQQYRQEQLFQLQNPRPEFRNVGNELLRLDPTTGDSTLVYQGKNPAEEYADSLGLAKGTPEHATAMQDYVLRANGPTAYGYDADLEGVKQQNRVGLEGVRQSNRLTLRTTPTYANTHPRAAAPRAERAPTPTTIMGGIISRYTAGKPLNERETTMLNNYNARGSGRRGGSLPGGMPSLPAPAPAPNGSVRKVSTPQEAMSLPSGTRFQTPDGTIKVRQ